MAARTTPSSAREASTHAAKTARARATAGRTAGALPGTPPLLGGLPLGVEDVLALQRSLGNHLVSRLLGTRPPATGTMPTTLQRKVYLGDTFTPFAPDRDAPRTLRNMARDDKTRRFKDKPEAEAFAAGGRDN